MGKKLSALSGQLSAKTPYVPTSLKNSRLRQSKKLSAES
jgi:hypothetical protein